MKNFLLVHPPFKYKKKGCNIFSFNGLVSINDFFKTKENIEFEKPFYRNGLAGLHPSCTTKIGDSPENGVVNSDLKLFNYDNIYVCGSSVFPFNGYTNPTWTIMTLALRLSEKLKKKHI